MRGQRHTIRSQRIKSPHDAVESLAHPCLGLETKLTEQVRVEIGVEALVERTGTVGLLSGT